MRIDLQVLLVHTNASDGALAPSEVVMGASLPAAIYDHPRAALPVHGPINGVVLDLVGPFDLGIDVHASENLTAKVGDRTGDREAVGAGVARRP